MHVYVYVCLYLLNWSQVIRGTQNALRSQMQHGLNICWTMNHIIYLSHEPYILCPQCTICHKVIIVITRRTIFFTISFMFFNDIKFSIYVFIYGIYIFVLLLKIFYFSFTLHIVFLAFAVDVWRGSNLNLFFDVTAGHWVWERTLNLTYR